MSYLNNLRKKPDSYKRAFAFVLSGSISGVVFIVWVISFMYSATSGEIAKENSNKTISPFKVITDQFGSVISEFKTQTAGINFTRKSEKDVSLEPVSTDVGISATPSNESTNYDASSSQVVE
ncbi:MAG: hypothetical protein RL094_608 [Candidatus Parcubacteria bacterium]|jgi:cytoskeletal protein RodZ